MADQFQNPADQAQLSQLYATLTALDADVKAIQEEIAAQSAAMREQQAVARRGEPRSTATAVPILREEVAAIDQQVVSYEKLNSLISQRIALEREAAAAARETAVATGAGLRGGVTGAGGWADPAERQRILGISSMGSAGAATASLGASGGAAAAAAASTTELAAAQREAATTAAGLAAAEIDAREAISSAALAVQEYDTKLASTGALSSTALAALGAGTITLRDLGHQVTETIGKFGGWTLAAGAVYGVLGALNEVRHGAIDTASTLQGLTKFLPPGQFHPDQARQQLVQQAQVTGTPLQDVGDAAQQFAKVFKTQGDVFTATHVALTAAKLDNISLADSYKYLTAIVQETGMGVGALPHIFDQITAAQDKLGARVSQLLPAYAGSVGAVQTAHGDPNELLGLEALTLVRTGRSGSQIGTAFSRGSTNFFPTANSRGVLERHGIDPNQGFTQALIEAIQKAPGISSDARREVSEAFFGTRFGAQLAPLFRVQPQQLQHFLAETAPGAHNGLADTQLGKTMSQADQQLNLLKVNLQSLGAELVGSGLATPFGLMLRALNEALRLTTELMSVWDGLPGPVKETASALALVAGAISVARRFNVGAMISGAGFPGAAAAGGFLSKTPEEMQALQADAAMKGLSSTISTELQAASVKQMRASLALARAQEQLTELTDAGIAEGEQYDAALAAASRAHEAEAAAVADIGFYQGLSNPASMAQLRNSMLAGAGGAGAAGGGALGAYGVDEAALGGAGVAASRRGIAGFFEKMSGKLGSKGADLEFLAQEGVDVGIGGAALAKIAPVASTAAAGLSDLATMAIPGAIAAFVAFAAASAAINTTEKDTTNAIKALSNARTPDQARRAYNSVVDAGPSLGPIHLGAVGNYLNGTDDAARAELTNQLGYLHAQRVLAQTGARAANTAGMMEMSGRYGAAYHRLLTDRAAQAIGHVDEITPFGSTQVPYAQLLKQYKVAYEGQAVTGGKGTNPFQMWEEAGQDLTNRLVPMLQGVGDAAKVYGTKSSQLGQLAAGYAYTVEKFGNNPQDVKAMQALAQAQSELVSGVDKQVQDLTNLASEATTNQGQRGYLMQALNAVTQTQGKVRAMFGAAEKLPGADIPQLRQAEQEVLGLVAQKRQSAIDGLLSLAKSVADLNTSKIMGVGPLADLQRAESTLQGLQNQLGEARSIGADASKIDALLTQVNQQTNTVIQDRINYYQQLAQAQIQYAQGSTADPVQQEQIAISRLQALYGQLKSAGADQLTLLQVSGQIRSDQLTQVSNQISAEQAGVQEWLSGANIGQPQQVQLRNSLTAAQRELAYLQSLPSNQVSPIQMANAISAVNQAKGAIAQWLIQQGEALIQAETALTQARTFDPVQIAQEALAGARKILAYDIAHNMPQAQITQDKANVAADLKARLSAQWEKQDQTIQFLMSTYQITGAQGIQRLQKLYDAMKKAGASYADLQRVAQEIYNLKFGGGNLNLNTGDIHLPSTYEVKSAILRGNNVQRRKTAAGIVADVKTDVKMNVYIHRDVDIRKVSKAIGDALGTSVHGLTQATGIMD